MLHQDTGAKGNYEWQAGQGRWPVVKDGKPGSTTSRPGNGKPCSEGRGSR
jgi:hypothetical protein